MSLRTFVGQQVVRPLELVEANFRKPSGWFGQMLGHIMSLQHKTLTVWVIDLMDIQPSDRILDVGCGGGMAVKLMAQRATSGFVAGVDYSAEMVEQATKRNADAVRRGQAEIKVGDAGNLPYPDASFDKVSGIETFYFWPDPMAGLREARRVLKPGGQITIAMEMSREAKAQKSKLQKYLSERFADRSAAQGMSIVSGPELVGMLNEAGFRRTRYESKPDKALGWLCALGTKDK
jgi:ubiquinone/menaquinone biosynthesis C-methylase UbiE